MELHDLSILISYLQLFQGACGPNTQITFRMKCSDMHIPSREVVYHLLLSFLPDSSNDQ